MEDTLRIKQNSDGSYVAEWDPQDPQWSFLNGLTGAEIQVMIEQALKEHNHE